MMVFYAETTTARDNASIVKMIATELQEKEG